MIEKTIKTMVLSLLFLLMVSGGLRSEAADSPANLIIISVDTLRADHLGSYGYPLNTSPVIDSFARDSVRFARCFTLTPLTSPAFSTMLTSLPPHKHGSKRNGLSVYTHIRTLPAVLREHGYSSTAYISNWSLRKKLCGLDRDFDHYHEVFNRRRWGGILNVEGEAQYVTRRAAKWLEDHARQRIFLWVHYSEPHAPYIQHKGYRFPYEKKHRAVYPEATNHSKIERYDSEIALTDYQIGLLIRKIKQMGLYEDALIIFNADHGESFGEHDYFRHGRMLYNSSLHVPLMIKLPGNRRAGTVNNRLVSLLDIAPTVLSLLKIPVPDFMEGDSVFSNDAARPVFCETYKGTSLLKKSMKFRLKVTPIRYAVLEGPYKLIFSEKSKKMELYDLAGDRFETRNIFPEKQKEIQSLETMLLDRIKKIKAYIRYSRKFYKQGNSLSEEDIRKLKSLGYIE